MKSDLDAYTCFSISVKKVNNSSRQARIFWQFIGFWMSYRRVSPETLYCVLDIHIFCVAKGLVLSQARIDVPGMDWMTSLIFFSIWSSVSQSFFLGPWKYHSIPLCFCFPLSALYTKACPNSISSEWYILSKKIYQRNQINLATKDIDPGLQHFHHPAEMLASLELKGRHANLSTVHVLCLNGCLEYITKKR